MKEGIIFDIKKYAINDGPGIRTTVFFKGCPLNCWWCHNPEGIDPKIEIYQKNKKVGYKIKIKDLMNEILKDQIFYYNSGGGVTFSGGEPLFQIDFLNSILTKCKKKNINTAIDTCGYSSISNINLIYEKVDLFLFDLKFINKEKHKKYTGKSNRIILRNLIHLTNKGKKVQIRIPLIPNITDTSENLLSIKEFLDKLKNIKEINLLPYNKYGEIKIKKFNIKSKINNLSTQPSTELKKIKKIFQSKKFIVEIGG
jgi:pyruvate formate lyase activating enzyme